MPVGRALHRYGEGSSNCKCIVLQLVSRGGGVESGKEEARVSEHQVVVWIKVQFRSWRYEGRKVGDGKLEMIPGRPTVG